MWQVVQEINDKLVPGSNGTYPLEACPWIPVAINRDDGDDYGSGFVWDYYGDFDSLEKLRKAILKGAAAAAKILWALDPNSPIREKQVAEAESGAVLRMRGNDLTAVQMQKMGDLQFARQEAEELKSSLEMVFGVRTAVQRNGDRVTAEEIRYLAQELEDSLVGSYTSIVSALLQLVRREMDRLQKQHRLPELPKGIIKPRITVGMAALGRGHDMRKLVEWSDAGKAAIGPEEFARRVDSGELLARLGAAADIPMKGLVKTDEQLSQEQTNTTAQDAIVRAAPQLAAAALNPAQVPA